MIQMKQDTFPLSGLQTPSSKQLVLHKETESSNSLPMDRRGQEK